MGIQCLSASIWKYSWHFFLQHYWYVPGQYLCYYYLFTLLPGYITDFIYLIAMCLFLEADVSLEFIGTSLFYTLKTLDKETKFPTDALNGCFFMNHFKFIGCPCQLRKVDYSIDFGWRKTGWKFSAEQWLQLNKCVSSMLNNYTYSIWPTV